MLASLRLMSHRVKIWERKVEAQLRQVVIMEGVEGRSGCVFVREVIWQSAKREIAVLYEFGCPVGVTEGFPLVVVPHQKKVFSAFLFARMMDRLWDEVRQGSLWTTMFADDLLWAGGTWSSVNMREEEFSHKKTECMCVNGNESSSEKANGGGEGLGI